MATGYSSVFRSFVDFAQRSAKMGNMKAIADAKIQRSLNGHKTFAVTASLTDEVHNWTRAWQTGGSSTWRRWCCARQAGLLQKLTNQYCANVPLMEALEQQVMDTDGPEGMRLNEQLEDLRQISQDALITQANDGDNEAFVTNIEQVLRDNPNLFPILGKYYFKGERPELDQVRAETSKAGIEAPKIHVEFPKVEEEQAGLSAINVEPLKVEKNVGKEGGWNEYPLRAAHRLTAKEEDNDIRRTCRDVCSKYGIKGLEAEDGAATLEVDVIKVSILYDGPANTVTLCGEISKGENDR